LRIRKRHEDDYQSGSGDNTILVDSNGLAPGGTVNSVFGSLVINGQGP